MRIHTHAKKDGETQLFEVHADDYKTGFEELKAKIPEGWQMQAVHVDRDEPVGGQQ